MHYKLTNIGRFVIYCLRFIFPALKKARVAYQRSECGTHSHITHTQPDQSVQQAGFEIKSEQQRQGDSGRENVEGNSTDSQDRLENLVQYKSKEKMKGDGASATADLVGETTNPMLQ